MGQEANVNENSLRLKSGIVVHWKPLDKYTAELDRPLGQPACRLCCERENGKENAQIGLIINGNCSMGCVFPDVAEADRIRREVFLASPVKNKTNKSDPSIPEYDRNANTPFRKGTADDRLFSVLLSYGREGAQFNDIYKKALPLFPDKDEKSIRIVCSVFVSRFSKAKNGSGFETVWDIAPKRGRGANAGARRIAIVFDGQAWPAWAIAKDDAEEVTSDSQELSNYC